MTMTDDSFDTKGAGCPLYPVLCHFQHIRTFILQFFILLL